MIALSIERVRKLLGGRWVLDGADLTWPGPGTLVLRGDNGTGKSTLLRIVTGIVPPDEGEVKIAGHALSTARLPALRALGYAPEVAELPGHLRAGELLALTAALKRCPPLDPALIDRLGATAILGQRLSTLSLGQRRRACLLSALTGDPALLVLDEPTNGLDVEGIATLATLLEERAAEGRAALIATHDRAFAERVAQRTVTLAGGVVR
ncbi:MAG: ABC transporter ATP-binding protein [Byssovorax sp.]